MARLKEQYQSEMVDALIKKFGYKNIMEVPKLDKIEMCIRDRTEITQSDSTRKKREQL